MKINFFYGKKSEKKLILFKFYFTEKSKPEMAKRKLLHYMYSEK